MSKKCEPSPQEPTIRRFGDCALVEIIHLHDCLRGALGDLHKDVIKLSQEFTASGTINPSSSYSSFQSLCNMRERRVEDLERRIAGRFQIIWSVFKAHSAAEDEFIWPALKEKLNTNSQNDSMPNKNVAQNVEIALSSNQDHQDSSNGNDLINETSHVSNFVLSSLGELATSHHSSSTSSINISRNQLNLDKNTNPPEAIVIEQEEYEEDHADEERMFSEMASLLVKLKEGLDRRKKLLQSAYKSSAAASKQSKFLSGDNNILVSNTTSNNTRSKQPSQEEVQQISQSLEAQTSILSQHLLQHLEKEENHCIPLVKEHLTHDEINDLVGRIMGKRSSDVMIQILNLAVNNLPEDDRESMVKYMKQAMVGTFFERWLAMGGHSQGFENLEKKTVEKKESKSDASEDKVFKVKLPTEKEKDNEQVADFIECNDPQSPSSSSSCSSSSSSVGVTTTQEELEKLIRAIASNPTLTSLQKNTTIQGLRDSVWKSRHKRKPKKTENSSDPSNRRQKRIKTSVDVSQRTTGAINYIDRNICQPAHRASSIGQRSTPPSNYYKKMDNGSTKLVWSSLSPMSYASSDIPLPLFSASELAPTFHDGATGAVLGCPHYARSCKLRHPSSGRLYTCRLCCEQEREMPMKDKDSPLDRYSVTEILCMRCNTLQPSGNETCLNPNCEPKKKPFSRYHCKICNLHDDTSGKSIYHCPFCNVCRSGKGLGIDYRHCMRCNACVSLSDDNHVCIPQRLQGNCPICHDPMFESTEPLRGLHCGHVMHLSCFSRYMRDQVYTCPLCKKSVEDMKEYFSQLDYAVRMQPMPAAYAATQSSIYCQDCGKVSKVPYHFVGCKCASCGSYNTREIQRSETESS